MNKTTGSVLKTQKDTAPQLLGRRESREKCNPDASVEETLVPASKKIGFSKTERAELKRLYVRSFTKESADEYR